MKALITRKVGMTSAIAEDGAVEAITLLTAEPNTITQLKHEERDGYTAVQLGYETAKHGKSQAGHYKPSKATPKVSREFRIDEIREDLKVGEQLSVDSFEVGDQVSVTATSKGKGWAGTIKRHNFHRQRKTHGGKGNTRKVGSIGSMYPQHIFKGNSENNLIGVSGAVPGPRKGIVMIRGTKA